MDYILFVLGFVILIKGADLLIEGSSAIARKLNVPDIVIGLTVLSFGTSLPELLVSLISNMGGNSDLAIGNVLGSNISNTLLVLGVAAIIYELPIRKDMIRTELPFSIVVILVVGFLANVNLFSSKEELIIGRVEGFILLFFFMLFLIYMFNLFKDNNEIPGEDELDFEHLPSLKKSYFYIILGIIGLYFGGEWVVDGAILISKKFGVSDAFIGLSIVALGTSLPELVTSAMAAYKKKADMAIGNVIGSNIFNAVWILGLSSVINPLKYNPQNNIDIAVILLSSVALFIGFLLPRKYTIGRIKGIILVLLYFLYIGFLFFRGF
ncbi:MAG: calcium/sodium antiporter, partial [Candidatus Cloacimonadota bacterium]|nr:calcium/sodium antiporter [Candidatus Cloacimonadota bacterium]